MATPELRGLTVAILATTGFEQVEFTEPRKALDDAGATTRFVAPTAERVRAWDRTDWGGSFTPDFALDAADPARFDALLLPGGVMSPDKLRMNERAVAFVRHFAEAGKPIAAICHGPWTLIEAGAVRGRRMTSYPSLRTDLKNAGADWVDEAVVEDGGLVTSRKPDDLPAFNRTMVEVFARAGVAA